MSHATPLALTCLAFLGPGCLAYQYRAELRGEHRAALDGVSKLAVQSSNGRVRVTCREGAEGLRIASVRFARGASEEDAREHAGAIRLEARVDPGEPDVYRVEVLVPVELGPFSAGADLELEMPPGADLDVRTSNGAIQVEGARGASRLRTSNGRVEVADFEGELDVKTSNGAVRLRDVGGGAITAVTSNGEIRLGLARAAAHPLISARTSNGSIELDVPCDVEAELSLRTSNGRVSRDLAGFRVTELESSRTRVSAVLNDGGGRIEAVTSNGGIRFGSRR